MPAYIFIFFFFNDTATTEIYTLSLHDALPISFALIAEPRVNADSGWIAKQKKRLGRRYESYWYTTVKGEWTKHSGWPTAPDDWKKMLAWIVRRKFAPSAATRASFPREAAKIFRDLYPLLRFTSLPD